MILLDVNVLVYALMPGKPEHHVAKDWLQAALVGSEPIGLWDSVLLSTYRIITHPRAFTSPATPSQALDALRRLRLAPSAVEVRAADGFWQSFEQVCGRADVRGGLTSDAMLAAVALENGAVVATFDSDFGKFEGLRWFTPS